MLVFLSRIFIFLLLPLIAAAGVIAVDKSASSKDRRLEVFLIFLFALGVGGSGVANFFAHFFLSDLVAESIGWPAGSPFQLEVAFANLLIGVLGFMAVGRRDGFREATVIAVTIFGVGATVVHIMDIAATGNLAPGNTLQNVLNLVKPALLIWILYMARQAEAAPESEARTEAFDHWRGPIAQAAGSLTGIVASAFGIGYALDRPLFISLIGAAIGLAVVFRILQQAPDHQVKLAR